MQRKCVFLFTAIILNCNIYGTANAVLENGAVEPATEIVAAEEEGDIEDEEAKSAEKMEDASAQETNETEQKEEIEEKNEAEVKEDTEQNDDSLDSTEEGQVGSEPHSQEEEIAQEPTEEEREQDCIYNVSFPTNSKAYLDPENLSGKGQVFSDEFKIENYGNTDIAIKIKNIEVYYGGAERLCELSEDNSADMRSPVKKIDVDIVWKNEKENAEKTMDVVEGTPDEYVLTLKASAYDEDGNFAGLNDGSAGLFYFTGNLNPDPEFNWDDVDITVSFKYEIVKAEEENTLLEE